MVAGVVIRQSIDTDFGRVKVQRVSYTDNAGYRISALLYKPDSATKDHPAPGVITAHGGGASLEAQSSYNVELARRGYVVLSYDAAGTGSSENRPITPIGSEDFDLDSWSLGGEATYNFLTALPYVDSSQIGCSGHSQGARLTYGLAQAHPDNIALNIMVGWRPTGNDMSIPFRTNYALILGTHDESNLRTSNNDLMTAVNHESVLKTFGLPEGSTIEIGKLYGSWEDKTGRLVVTPEATHAGAMVTAEVIEDYINIMNEAIPAPAPLPGSDQIWQVKDVGMAIQFVGLILFMFLLAVAALDLKFFQSLKLPVRAPVGYKTKSAKWYLALGILLFVPTILYVPSWTITQRHTIPKFFGMDANANGFAIWGAVSALVLLMLFLIFHFTHGRKHGGNLMTYGLATEPEKNRIGIKYLLKALLFALLVVGGTFLVYLLMYGITGGDIHIWLATLRPVTFIRAPLFPLYFLLQLPFFFVATVAGRSISLNNGERTSGKGMRNSLILSGLIGVLGMGLLFLVFELVLWNQSVVLFAQDRGYIACDGIFAMLPALLIGNLINCYITNKTNSNWAGVFTAMMWTAWICVGANALA